MFDLVGGLPLHILVVHVAVVLLPLAALGLLAVVWIPKARGRVQTIVILGGLIVGNIASIMAKFSGEELAERVGTPKQHAELGEQVFWIGLSLLIAACIWFYLESTGTVRKSMMLVASILISILAVLAMWSVTITGHTGADAVWKARVSSYEPSTAPVASSSPSSTSGAVTGSTSPYTAATVAQHASPADCWSIVDANVYDLTKWIPLHPGGPSVIEKMCGVDGSAMFGGQHSGSPTAAAALKQYLLGAVGSAAVSTPSGSPSSSATASPTSSSSASSTASAASGYTAATVAQHASPSDCWSIVNGSVYDLTKWIPLHPGGPGVIQSMCGVDGSAMFNGQHSGSASADAALKQYLLGALT